MKILFKFSSLGINPLGVNPIYRDLLLVLIAGILTSVAIVSVGYMISTQV